jgi:hypothetical protein
MPTYKKAKYLPDRSPVQFLNHSVTLKLLSAVPQTTLLSLSVVFSNFKSIDLATADFDLMDACIFDSSCSIATASTPSFAASHPWAASSSLSVSDALAAIRHRRHLARPLRFAADRRQQLCTHCVFLQHSHDIIDSTRTLAAIASARSAAAEFSESLVIE